MIPDNVAIKETIDALKIMKAGYYVAIKYEVMERVADTALSLLKSVESGEIGEYASEEEIVEILENNVPFKNVIYKTKKFYSDLEYIAHTLSRKLPKQAGELVEKSQEIGIINMKLKNIKLAIDDIISALSPEAEKCPECLGTGNKIGKFPWQECSKCGGTGERRKE